MKWIIFIVICFLGAVVNGRVDLGNWCYVFGFAIGTICQVILAADF